MKGSQYLNLLEDGIGASNNMKKIVKNIINHRKRIIWFFTLIIVPLILSLIFYNPFIKYDIDKKVIKIIMETHQINDQKPYNLYRLTIENLNATEINNYLVASYIEDLTNLAVTYKRYDLYFEDNTEFESPMKIIINESITVENKTYDIGHKESKKIISNIDFNKTYHFALKPQVTLVMVDDQPSIVEKFKPSWNYYIMKSKQEFFIKYFALLIIWVGIVTAIYFMYEKTIKGNKT